MIVCLYLFKKLTFRGTNFKKLTFRGTNFKKLTFRETNLRMLSRQALETLKAKKQKIIDDIIEKNKHAPPQGSKEWIADRKFTIGGSVMSTIIDKDIPNNKSYGTIRNLAEQKIELVEFKTMPAMRWGNLCEPISRMYTEHVLDTTISETGAVAGRITNHKYSPDGMGVVSMKKLERLMNSRSSDSESDEHDEQSDSESDAFDSCFSESDSVSDTSDTHWKRYPEIDEYDCVLFEYKNPFSRIPDGKIMTGYQIQMQTGMYTIPEMSMGLFVDSVVRRCSLEDLNGGNAYNTTYHKPGYINDPLCWGFIGVYEDKPVKRKLSTIEEVEEIEEPEEALTMDEITECIRMDSSKSRNRSKANNVVEDIVFDEDSFDLIDFGSCSTKDFDKFTKGAITDKVFKLYYTEPQIGQFKYFTWLDKFLKFCEDGNFVPVGLMPWKMFQIELIPLRKDTKFWKPIYQQRINALIDFVQKYHDKTDREKRIALEKYFPRYGNMALNEVEEEFLKKHGILTI